MKFLTKIFSCIALMVLGGEAWAAPQHISIGERDFEAITAFTVDTSVDSLELPNGPLLCGIRTQSTKLQIWIMIRLATTSSLF